MNLELTNFDFSWTLFLDRDGIINKKIENDYVKKWDDFHFIEGVLPALKQLSKIFHRIILVTNQQGIGKGLFTEIDLKEIHRRMLFTIEEAGGRIDKIYYSPALANENSIYRKPAIGMALQAKNDFREINFEKSIMVGDSISDMQFGRTAGMKTIFVSESGKENLQKNLIDSEIKRLSDLVPLIFKQL
jgi:histidinol-phosphate phosphatase family protein